MSDECSLCTDQLLGGGSRISATPCGHVFHSDCISDFLKRENLCPFCKVDLEPNDVIRILTFEANEAELYKLVQEEIIRIQMDSVKISDSLQNFLQSINNMQTTMNELKQVNSNLQTELLSAKEAAERSGNNEERKRLHEENQSLKAQIDSLKDQVESLKKQSTEKRKSSAIETINLTLDFDSDETL